MVPEAELNEGDGGLVPASDGWFVMNARSAQWWHTADLGSYCPFETKDVRFPQLGINLNVIQPGQPSCMYHAENSQEDFLVLAGECVLLIEGEERRLGPFDFVHCPAGTNHVFVGAGDAPCLFLATGARRPRGEGEVHYPAAEIAQRYDAAVLESTDSPAQAYARFAPPTPGPSPELPG